MDPTLASVVIVITLSILGIIVALLAVAIVAVVYGQSDIAVAMGKVVERITRDAVRKIPKP